MKLKVRLTINIITIAKFGQVGVWQIPISIVIKNREQLIQSGPVDVDDACK